MHQPLRVAVRRALDVLEDLPQSAPPGLATAHPQMLSLFEEVALRLHRDPRAEADRGAQKRAHRGNSLVSHPSPHRTHLCGSARDDALVFGVQVALDCVCLARARLAVRDHGAVVACSQR
jgi:hypothetical protein